MTWCILLNLNIFIGSEGLNLFHNFFYVYIFENNLIKIFPYLWNLESFCCFFVVLLNITCAKKSSIPIIFAICEGPYSNILSTVKPLICNISIKSFEISNCSNRSSFHIAIVIYGGKNWCWNDNDGRRDSSKFDSFIIVIG